MNLSNLNLRPLEKAHMEALMDSIMPKLERSVESVHDYGCRQDGGLPVLQQYFSNVKGFDTDNTYGEPPNYGDIHEPKEDADLICVLHVIETYPIKVEKAMDAMAARCKYLALSTHAHVSKIHQLSADFWPRLIHTDWADVEECGHRMHIFYLFKGDL